MSVLNRIRPCPCRSWRCRAFYAARGLAVIAAVAVDLYGAHMFGAF